MSKDLWTGRLRLPVAAIGFCAVVMAGAVAGQEPYEVPQARVQARGLADSSVSRQNGAFATRVAIDLPRFHGITPQLGVNYSSAAGNGFVGVGWDLAGFSVIERASPGRGSPRMNNSVQSYLLDGEELVANTALGGTHATLRQSHLRIGLANNVWKVIRRDGTVMTYSPTFMIGGAAFRWGLTEVKDRNNNAVKYTWACDGTPHQDCYPASITYGNTVVTVDREARPDALTFATGYGLGSTTSRLKDVTVKVGGLQRSRHHFTYRTSARTQRSILTQVLQYGRDNINALPPVTLAYAEGAANFDAPAMVPASAALDSNQWLNSALYTHDFNGDGRQDVLTRSNDRAFLLRAKSGGFELPQDITNVGALTRDHWKFGSPVFGDYNGDGRTDILLRVNPPFVSTQPDPARVYYLESTGNSFQVRDLTTSFGYTLKNWKLATIQIGDFNGDGCTDLFLLNNPVWNVSQPNPTTAHILYGDVTRGFAISYQDVTRRGGMTADTWRESNFDIADFNGDGLSDLLVRSGYAPIKWRKILLAKGEGVSISGPFEDGQSLLGQYGLTDANWNSVLIPGDFNGDGRADLMLQAAPPAGGQTLMLYSRGGDRASTMFNAKLDLSNHAGMAIGDWIGAVVFPGDYDGDGRLDLLVFRATTSTTADTAFLLHSRGNGFAPRVNYTVMHGMTNPQWRLSTVHPADLDGDGDTDLLVRSTAPSVVNRAKVFAASGTATDLVTDVINGHGGRTTVQYKPSSVWTSLNGPPITQTVSALLVNDGRGGVATTKYEYGEGLWDGAERRHLGFGWVKATDPSLAYEVSEFYQGREYQVGDLKRSSRYSAAGLLMSRSERDMPVVSANRPYLARVSNAYESEFNGDALGITTATTFGYDAYGNVTSQLDQGNTALTGDERITYTEYMANTTDYVVDRPARTTVHAGMSATGTLLRETRVHYDNASAYTTAPVKGNATASLVKLDATRFLTSKRTYDPFGNVDSETTPMGFTSVTVWDAQGLYPSGQANALNHTTGFAWDAVCDDKSRTTDPNGKVTTWEYDNFCRKKKETRPDTGYTTWAYNNFGTVATQHVRESVRASTLAGDEIWKDTYFDGLGRTYKEVGEGTVEGGVRIDRITDTTYNTRGLVASVSAPHGPAEAAKNTAYAYDALGRPQTITFPDASTHQFHYGDDFVTICDELGKPRTSYRDAYGQVVRVREFLGKTCVATPTGTLGTDMFDTSIAYDMLGQRRSVTDAKGNVTTTTYDLAGRVTATDDPDLGVWTFGYDDDGRRIRQVDAKGAPVGELTFGYDAIGRLTSKYAPGPKVTRAIYRYDEAGHGAGIGRLTSVSSLESNSSFEYDAMGRVQQEWRLIQSSAQSTLVASPTNFNYTVRTVYDVMGRLQSVKYPTAEQVNYTYDAAGRPLSAAPYVTAATYDARDNLRSRTLGNGVVESFSYDANRHWGLSYAAAKGATSVHNVVFTRNTRGEVKTRANALVATDQWTYTYDDLRRLTRADSTANSAWLQVFAYDAVGRMTSQTGAGSYNYPAPTAAGPAHAPAGVNGLTYQYDANGRMLNDGTRTITWDVDGNATSVKVTSSGATDTHKYDADGGLVATNGIHFMTQYYERNVAGQVGTSYFYFGGKRVARKYNGAVHYYHSDQLGSVGTITDSAGAVVSRKVFSAFGRLLWQSGSLADNFGLAGERRSATTNFYDMGARKMSPGAAMFISPDPSDAPDPTRPQTLNRFAYANNSPTNLVDPTGYEAVEPSCPVPAKEPSTSPVVHSALQTGVLKTLVEVDRLVSTQVENLNTFSWRVYERMQSLTQATGFEHAAGFSERTMTSSTSLSWIQYGALIQTSGSPLVSGVGLVLPESACWKYLPDLGTHTHGYFKGDYRLNALDVTYLDAIKYGGGPYALGDRARLVGSGPPLSRGIKVDRNNFSPIDLASPHGSLVTPGGHRSRAPGSEETFTPWPQKAAQ